MGCDCALALCGSGARVSVLGFADMGQFVLSLSVVLVLVCFCVDTPIWASIALSLSLVRCSCSFLSWRRDSSLGLPIQLTTEIVQLQPIDNVFDGRLCMFFGCRCGEDSRAPQFLRGEDGRDPTVQFFAPGQGYSFTGACHGPDSAEYVEFTQVQFLNLVLCPSLCNDRCWDGPDSAETVESPQLALTFGQGCRRARVGRRGV